MLELQTCALLRLGRQPHLDPAHVSEDFPGQRELPGRLACGDRPARDVGALFKLVPSSESELTADRREPPLKSLRNSQRLPQIIRWSGIRFGSDDHLHFVTVALRA